MVVRLLRSARINHEAGDIVEVSPAQGAFLMSVGSACPVEYMAKTQIEKPEERKTTRKTAKK